MSYSPATGRTQTYKYVLVLAALHDGKMHGLDLGTLTEAQRDVVRTLFDPDHKPKQQYPLVNNVVKQMDVINEIKNPVGFYHKFVKPFLSIAGDVYRTYIPAKMSGVQIIEKVGQQSEFNNRRMLQNPPETGESQPMATRGRKPTPFSSQAPNKGPLFKK